jgi:hypothetical protein
MIRCGLGFRLCEAMFQELSGAWSFGFQGEIYGGMQQVHLFAPRRLAKRSKSGAKAEQTSWHVRHVRHGTVSASAERLGCRRSSWEGQGCSMQETTVTSCLKLRDL